MTATATKTKPASGIRLARTDLLAALVAVGKAVPTRSPKPILQNVRIGDGLVTGTDLEVRVDRVIEEQCEPFLVPHARLLNIVREARGDEVTLKPKDTSIVVKCGGGSWTLPTEDVREFPAWEPEGMTPVCRLPADQFARAVRSTVYACDTESSRYALGAVLLEIAGGNPTFIATDGRRLSLAETETDQAVDDRSVLVPARVMQLVLGLFAKKKKHKDALAEEDEHPTDGDINPDFASVQIESNNQEVVFSIKKTTVTARLTDGRFPRWRDVVGEPEGEATIVEIAELVAATRAAAIVTSEQSKGIDLSWQGETLVLHGRSAEYGESTVKCPVITAGSQATVKLDPHYIVDFLRNLPADDEPQVEVFVKDAASRVLIRCGDYTGVIMPLNIEG